MDYNIKCDIIRDVCVITPEFYREIGDEGVERAIQKTKKRAYALAEKLGWTDYTEDEMHSPDYNRYDIETPAPIDLSHKTVLPLYIYKYQIVLRKSDV